MPSLTFQFAIDDELFKKIDSEYQAGNYSSAIKTAILYLSEEIRGRTDLDSDGESLITKAFSEKAPLIKINKLETETDRSEQVGFMNLLQGLYKGIRNPRNHNLKADNKEECDEIIVFINYLLRIIKSSKRKFDYIEFKNVVDDKYFICADDYAKEISEIIPVEKLTEVAQKLIESIDGENYKKVALTISAIKGRITDDEQISFFQGLNDVLFRTQDILLVRAATLILRQNWSKLAKVTRMRLESILLDGLKSMEFVEETEIDSNSNFKMIIFLNEAGETARHIQYISDARPEVLRPHIIKPIIQNNLRRGAVYFEFIIRNFSDYVFRDKYILYEGYDDIMIELMTDTNSPAFKLLTSGYVQDGEFEPYYSVSSRVSGVIKTLQKN